ncbi:hypothetical protein KC19_7G134700 [Ceratodon purpureus]|uniref:Alpha/beta hydrolase fold-3 domain-containing protein n=1 Tax=Ceratodon purpureus TaxID=3225 RepID=A0A8T0H998_CERPU|nr:hypothetical protein KC19_7G134700 [Ceratodon purpureus]
MAQVVGLSPNRMISVSSQDSEIRNAVYISILTFNNLWEIVDFLCFATELRRWYPEVEILKAERRRPPGQAEAQGNNVGVRLVKLRKAAQKRPEPTEISHHETTQTMVIFPKASLQANREGDESWLTKHADFSMCFVMGESAGSNIVHHLGLQFAKSDLNTLSISKRAHLPGTVVR